MKPVLRAVVKASFSAAMAVPTHSTMPVWSLRLILIEKLMANGSALVASLVANTKIKEEAPKSLLDCSDAYANRLTT